jgi:hypothetical protein
MILNALSLSTIRLAMRARWRFSETAMVLRGEIVVRRSGGASPDR